jgi:hypothetical protein
MNKVVSAMAAFTAGAALALAVPAEANADPQWGVMVWSPSQSANAAVNWGTGPTMQVAKDAAFKQCSASDCAWVGTTQGGCVALLSNNNGWGGGDGPTKDAAIQGANTDQALGGAPGQVVAIDCV